MTIARIAAVDLPDAGRSEAAVKALGEAAMCISAHAYLQHPVTSDHALDQPLNFTLGQVLQLFDGVEQGSIGHAEQIRRRRSEAQFAAHRAENEIGDAFKRLKLAEDGEFDLHELMSALEIKGANKAEIDELTRRFDVNGDGYIAREEFEDMVKELNAEGGNDEVSKWSRQLTNYRKLEARSRKWLEAMVQGQMDRAEPDQENPMIFVPYGPPGCGKDGATRRVLESHGLTKTQCIDVNIDDFVRSYMKTVLKNEHLFSDQSVYFAVREGWPSRAKAESIRRATETRRHIIKETTGRDLSTAEDVIGPAYSGQGYSTVIIYPLTPFVKIVARVLKRKLDTGQGHPPLKQLAETCRRSARNLAAFRDSGGDKATVVFSNNCGPYGSDHLIEDPGELYQIAVAEPFQHENRAMLIRESQGKRYADDALRADFPGA